jgi:hypothetical protein
VQRAGGDGTHLSGAHSGGRGKGGELPLPQAHSEARAGESCHCQAEAGSSCAGRGRVAWAHRLIRCSQRLSPHAARGKCLQQHHV